MLKIAGGAGELRRNRRVRIQFVEFERYWLILIEYLQQFGHVRFRGGFVQGNSDLLVINLAQVDSMTLRQVQYLPSRNVGSNGQRIEIVFGGNAEAQLLQSSRQRRGQTVDIFGDGAEALWTMINGKHCPHVRKKGLGCADVACGF